MKKLFRACVSIFLVSTTFVTLALDSDCDGINDAWEVEYGFSLTSNTSPGTADADSDGYSDYQEGLFGSNPQSGSSMPQPNAPVINGDEITISSPAYIGNRYLIQDAGSMFGPFVTVETVDATTTTVSRIFTFPNESGRNFYAIVGTSVTCTGIDTDDDETVDAIDNDDDNDEILDENDNCPTISNADQLNTDGDAQGDVCDNDDDNDGISDQEDSAPTDKCAPNSCGGGGGSIIPPSSSDNSSTPTEGEDDGGELICKGPNTDGNWYRKCLMTSSLSSDADFAQNLVCEGFMPAKRVFHYASPISRIEVARLVVKMGYTKSTAVVKNTFADAHDTITNNALGKKIINPFRPFFEPERDVTRSEAYSMIMSSVCMINAPIGKEANWQRRIFGVASDQGLTNKLWSEFDGNGSITQQELYRVAAKAADWAEETGGCNPKPASCITE